MNKYWIILLLAVLISSFILRKPNQDKGLGRVEKIDGKEIYLFSEPLQAYKVVGDYNNSKNIISSCNLRNLIDSYLKRAQKDKIKFDALYMDTSDNIYLIQFIKEAED